MTGILGNAWTMNDFSPMESMPSKCKLTCYDDDASTLSNQSLQEFINAAEKGTIKLNIDSIFSRDHIAEAPT